MDTLASFIAQYFYVIVIIVAVLYLIWYYRLRLISLGVAAIFISGLSYVLSLVGTQLFYDPRPFIESGTAALISSSTDNGFPSDHTLLVAIVAAVVTVANWKAGLVVWAMALLVGLARVYARVHHLIDIVGSLALVAAVLLLYWLISSFLQRRYGKSQHPLA